MYAYNINIPTYIRIYMHTIMYMPDYMLQYESQLTRLQLWPTAYVQYYHMNFNFAFNLQAVFADLKPSMKVYTQENLDLALVQW